MYHSFDERIQFTIIFSFSKRAALYSKFNFVNPCLTEGPIKSLLSVYLSATSTFFSEMGG